MEEMTSQQPSNAEPRPMSMAEVMDLRRAVLEGKQVSTEQLKAALAAIRLDIKAMPAEKPAKAAKKGAGVAKKGTLPADLSELFG
jgi:hypothetical protein